MRSISVRDERGIIGDWLIKLVIFILLLGLVVVDGGSIAVNFFGLDSKADEIAVQVATTISRQRTVLDTPHVLEAEAQTLADEAEAKLLLFELDEEQRTVFVRIRRRASTLIVKHIGFISDWTRATTEGRSGF